MLDDMNLPTPCWRTLDRIAAGRRPHEDTIEPAGARQRTE